MKLFEWTKEKHDGMITCGVDWKEWGLPFSVHLHFDKFNKGLFMLPDGETKKKPTGWCSEIIISFLCFYLYVEFDYWYSEGGNGKN